MENMCPPTMVGRLARSPKVTGTDDALRLADHVVVHHHRVRRGALAHRLELASGVAAGPAEVALDDHAEPVAEEVLGRLEELRLGDGLGALLHHEDVSR